MNTTATHNILPGQPGGLPPRRPRLLVVDDQPINIQVLHQVFQQDHQVLMATSGAQALAMCESKQPDLVLLDVEMPGLDGYQVCEKLKANPATRDIAVIFVTAHRDDASQERGLEIGAVDFIFKPVNAKIVRARVKHQLMLKRQSDLLRDFAYLDGLTGVKNRRYFDERLEGEWRRAVRHGDALSLVMVDVDYFKRFNDKYGHQTGDDCLCRIASALRGCTRRPGDLVARYGGEEFVALLPETDLSGATQFARGLAQAVASLQITHGDSAVAAHVTVSAGVCTRAAHSTDLSQNADSLLRSADEQLYLAKQSGRNQACAIALA